MKEIIAMTIFLCAVLSSCSTIIEKAMDSDWLKYQHMMKNHPNPSGYPKQP